MNDITAETRDDGTVMVLDCLEEIALHMGGPNGLEIQNRDVARRIAFAILAATTPDRDPLEPGNLDENALTVAHLAVEDTLIELRDMGIITLHANGFVVRNRDASDSSIMRMGTRDGLAIGIKAYLGALPGGA